MATVNISMPDDMRLFVERQVSEAGFGTTSEYVRSLIREAQRRVDDEALQRQLLEGLRGETLELTPADWQAIRNEALKRATKRKAR